MSEAEVRTEPTATSPTRVMPDPEPFLRLWEAAVDRDPALQSLFARAVRNPAPFVADGEAVAEMLTGLALGCPEPSEEERAAFLGRVHEGMRRWSRHRSTRAAGLFVAGMASGWAPQSARRWAMLGGRAKVAGTVRAVRTLAVEVVEAGWYDDELALLADLRRLCSPEQAA